MMGRATNTREEYRDDPDSVSLHTTPDGYSYDDAPEIDGMPPSYSDSEIMTPTTSTAAPPARHIQPPFTRMDHNNAVHLSGGKPQVCDTQKLMDARYDTDPMYLEDAIRSFANDPPIPLIYIMGTHWETTKRGDKKERREITDFRIVLNLQKYLTSPAGESPMTLHTVENGEKAYRGTILKKRAPGFKQDIEVGAVKPELKEWCHRYCASPSRLRIFRLRRTLTGFDEALLRSRLEGLISATNYRGRINITFPIEDKNIDLYTSNRANQWRLKRWVCWIFYLSFLWIFTWPYLFFATKRYAIVKAEWPWSKTHPNGAKTYPTFSEDQYFEKWQVAIRRLVLDRFQGEATDDFMMGVMTRPTDPPMPGTVSTGHIGIDNAVGMLQSGFQFARALSNGDGRGLQGGWGYDT